MTRSFRPPAGLLLFLLLVTAIGGYALGCGPLPGESRGTPAPPPDIVTVHTGDGRYFYLVDTRRELCFFGDRYRPQLTKVPCEDVPEAYELLGWEEDPGLPLPASDEEGQPSPSPEPSGDIVPPPEPADPGPPPTPEEQQAFEQAFVEYFCATRQPRDDEAGPPDETTIIERHGLTTERYGQVRDHLSSDEAAWRSLSQRALQACP